MNTKELMVGNHVLENGKEITIESISDYDWVNITIYEGSPGEGNSDFRTDIKYIQGIKLTVDVMKKFGFDIERNSGLVYFLEFSLHAYKDDYGVTIWLEQYSEGEIRLPHIVFAHQLQNLFYTLAGMELKFRN